MSNHTKVFKQVQTVGMLLAVALLLALAITAVGMSQGSQGGPFTAAMANADDDDDRGERRINRTTGRGLRACQAAKRRIGGGICTRVIEDRDDRERYEVSLRKGAYRYEIDLSRTYRVLDVDRDRIGGSSDDNDDDNDNDEDGDD